MSDPAILFVKPKAISQRDKKSLSAAGVIVVEVEDPNAVKFVRAAAELSSTSLLAAATDAIHAAGFDSVKVAFAKGVIQAIRAKAPPIDEQRS